MFRRTMVRRFEIEIRRSVSRAAKRAIKRRGV